MQEERRKRIEFFISALKFFNDGGVGYYKDTPEDLLDIFIFNVVITFDKYKDWDFKRFSAIRSMGINGEIEFLEGLKKLTLDSTVAVLEFKPEEKQERQNINKAIDVAVKHAQEKADTESKVIDQRVELQERALIEPEKIKEQIVTGIEKEVGVIPLETGSQLNEAINYYIERVANAESPNNIPEFDSKAIGDLILQSPVVGAEGVTGVFASPLIVIGGVKELAKEGAKQGGEEGHKKIVLATAFILSSQNEEDLVRMGMNRQAIHGFTEELNNYARQGHKIGWIEKSLLAEKYQLKANEVKFITEPKNMTYAIFNQSVAPHQSFLGSISQRFFGKISKNLIQRSVGVAGSQVVSGATNVLVAAGEVLSNAIPFFGPILAFILTKIVGWIVNQLITKIVPWIKKHLGAILGLLGGGAALYFGFGAVGAAIAGVGGLALGGAVTGVGAGAAIFGFFGFLVGAAFTAFLIPLLITLIGIPIVVAIILFIINSGTYVVPPAQPCMSSSTTPLASGAIANGNNGQSVKIMALGDSITYGFGSSTLNGYRLDLYNKLKAAGMNVQFVGTVISGGDPVTHHEGYPREGTHAGTNRLCPSLGGLCYTANAQNVSKIIDKIEAKNPNVKIILAQIITLHESATTEADTGFYNQALQSMASQRNDSHITLVNMQDVLTNTDYKDSVHPNDGGYQKMADLWFSGFSGVSLPSSSSLAVNPCQKPSQSPPGCPSGWPVATDQGQTYHINQGPGGPASHGPPAFIWQEAVDILPHRYNPKTDLVLATAQGTVNRYSGGVITVPGPNGTGIPFFSPAGPNGVSILGTCMGQKYRISYAHMLTATVNDGDQVTPGQSIGVLGNLGYTGGLFHLHYEFREGNWNAKDVNAGSPTMITPYIPVTVPRKCLDGTAISCNVEIP